MNNIIIIGIRIKIKIKKEQNVRRNNDVFILHFCVSVRLILCVRFVYLTLFGVVKAKEFWLSFTFSCFFDTNSGGGV